MELRDDAKSKIGERMVTNLKQELVRQDKVVSGMMMESIKYFPEDNTVGSMRDGMGNIEYGRAAGHHVPLKPLIEWAKTRFGLSDGDAWAMAKSVEAEIFENGIPMTRFTKIALEKMSD